MKEWPLAALALALAIGAILMVTDALRAKFEQLVAYDPLTGSLSRAAWLAACQRELDRARRHNRPLSVLLIALVMLGIWTGIIRPHGVGG